jgi:phosphoenolpyruvate-protein kinase (PTS system EI component)
MDDDELDTITSLAASRAAAAIDAVDNPRVQARMGDVAEIVQDLLTMLCQNDLPQKQATQIVLGAIL